MVNLNDIKSMTFNGIEASKITGATLGVVWESGGSELPYTPIEGILSTTGTEHINTGASWDESCVWEVTGYSISSGKYQYGYSTGGIYEIRNQGGNYQLGSTYNPLTGTNIFESATTKYTYTVNDVPTKDITAKLEVQGSSIELNMVGAYITTSQKMRIGQQLYMAGPTGMVTQEVKRFVNDALVLHYKSCLYEGQAGMWDMLNNTFVGNSGSGSYAEVAPQATQLMAIGVQPEATQEMQIAQLLAIGVE